jgi:hypothetical protein
MRIVQGVEQERVRLRSAEPRTTSVACCGERGRPRLLLLLLPINQPHLYERYSAPTPSCRSTVLMQSPTPL